MARLNGMLMTYFVTGAIMWATGFLEWEETGAARFFVSVASGDVSGATSVQTQLTDMGGPIGNVVNTLGGGLLASWGVISQTIGFVFWPITVLNNTGAPIEVTVLLGGPPSVAFVGAFILLVRGSA
jgi:hypothetical protein